MQRTFQKLAYAANLKQIEVNTSSSLLFNRTVNAGLLQLDKYINTTKNKKKHKNRKPSFFFSFYNFSYLLHAVLLECPLLFHIPLSTLKVFTKHYPLFLVQTRKESAPYRRLPSKQVSVLQGAFFPPSAL